MNEKIMSDCWCSSSEKHHRLLRERNAGYFTRSSLINGAAGDENWAT
jgi:hypothetical protein